ncbi:MAG: ribosomal RNA small subunit methyltransferase A [Candidatus Rokuibacteriota bacterium]|nr:MAG: ribosomal RNA small subunit methyltransferase A [Candidatus Rokubacteria bacterium]
MPAAGKRRALGQHFLRDVGVARAIVDLVSPTRQDLVLEIGPGEGALTALLASRAGVFLALEIDRELAERLAGRFDVRVADGRTFDYGSLSAPVGRVLVVGNLPYSVSKPILMRLSQAHGTITEMALMLQREVAERVAAGPGGKTYGSLSILTQLRWEVRQALRVPPGAFRPPPRVESVVLHLKARTAPAAGVDDEGRFRRVVLAAFSQRRKAVANAVAAGLKVSVLAARERLIRCGIDPTRRAETLSLADFARLAETADW